jgi:hypothetical protein
MTKTRRTFTARAVAGRAGGQERAPRARAHPPGTRGLPTSHRHRLASAERRCRLIAARRREHPLRRRVLGVAPRGGPDRPCRARPPRCRGLLPRVARGLGQARRARAAVTPMRRWRACSPRSRSSPFASAAWPAARRPGASGSPISRATPPVRGSTRLWAAVRPSRPSSRPPDPVSTETGDDHGADPARRWRRLAHGPGFPAHHPARCVSRHPAGAPAQQRRREALRAPGPAMITEAGGLPGAAHLGTRGQTTPGPAAAPR